MRLKILKYIYQYYINQNNTLCYLLFNQIDTNIFEIKNTLKNLETDGYIEIIFSAIGATYIKLTSSGFDFCENYKL